MPLRQYMRSFSHATIPNASSETGFAKVKHARYVHIRNAVACHAYDRLSLSAYPDEDYWWIVYGRLARSCLSTPS